MGLIKNRDTIKLSPDDGEDQYLINKLVEGANVEFSIKDDPKYGKQLVLSVPGKVPGAGDNTLELDNDGVILNEVNLVLVDTSKRRCNIMLPFAAEYIGWLSIVCVNNDNSFTLTAQDGDTVFDESNLACHAVGDALTFASDRKKTWFCIGRYSAQWYA